MSEKHVCGGGFTHLRTDLEGHKATITVICIKCQHKEQRIYWASPIYHKEGKKCRKILTMQ